MHGTVKVGAYVVIQEGCPLSCSTVGSAQAEFTCGSPRDGFEFAMDYEPLKELVKLGTAALAEMDALSAKEEAEQSEATTDELVPAEKRSV